MAHLIPSYFVSKDNLLGEHRIFQILKNRKLLEDIQTKLRVERLNG